MEKASICSRLGSTSRKHLHGRGEDPSHRPLRCLMTETPPRKWRRPSTPSLPLFEDRNTSTDMEKTHRHDPCFRITWKHLHGRGEDCKRSELWFLRAETPPRTWRRQVGVLLQRVNDRNTSTDVEKTHPVSSHPGTIQKHLHGRGEDTTVSGSIHRFPETPPRTWRRHQHDR